MPFIKQFLNQSKRLENRDFGIVKKDCHFCGHHRKHGQEELIKFNEHYYFCPNCTTIYTYLIVQKTSCIHIDDDTPTVFRKPWYKDTVGAIHIVYDDCGVHKCSYCHHNVLADGW